MIEGVLFDLGDTLAHFKTDNMREVLRSGCRSLHEHLVERGYPLPAFDAYMRRIIRHVAVEYLRSKITHREVEMMRSLHRMHLRYGVDFGDDNTIRLGHDFVGPAVAQYLTLDPAAREVITGLHDKGLKLGIVSNTILPDFTVDAFLRDHRLLDYLPVRVYSSAVRFMKPHRRIFDIALEQLGVAPDRILFVGDRRDNDVRGAARVGMKTALLLHDGVRPRHRGRWWVRAKPDYAIHDLSEVPAILSSRSG